MKHFKGILLSIAFLLVSISARSQPTDSIGVHDPVLIQQGGTYYLFSTGAGIAVWSSKDLSQGHREKPVFDKAPPWAAEVAKGFKNHIWAPDIAFRNGQYYLYYSISAFGKNTSAIGVATNRTLHPEDPDFKWVDQGIVVQSVPNRDLWNAIDPNLIVDEEGTPWLSFGSFWGGLKLVKLDTTLLAVAKPEVWHTLAKKERNSLINDDNAGQAAVEAPFIITKNGYYYLFASYDYCCRGASSTYKVRVGRSKKVSGPYLDRDNVAMDKGGGSLVIEGNAAWAGVGHNSAYTFQGKDYFVFHAYDRADKGRAKLKISEMHWDSEGWPVVDQKNLH